MSSEEPISLEQMAKIRNRCRELPGITQKERAKHLTQEFPALSMSMLEETCAVVSGCTEKVWAIFMAGKLKGSIIREMYSMDPADQDNLADECVKRNLSRGVVKKVRHFKKDLRMKMPEAIDRAVRESEESRSRSIENLLKSKRDAGQTKKRMTPPPEITREVGAEMRKRFRMAIGKSNLERAQMYQKDYPWVTLRTLESYAWIANHCSEKVWNFLIDGKISLTVCEEMTSWELADQDKIIGECEKRGIKLSVQQMRAFKKGGTLKGIEEVFAAPEAPPVEAAPAPVPVSAASQKDSPPSPVEEGEEDSEDGGGEETLPGDSRFSVEEVLQLRQYVREMPEEMSYESRIADLSKKYPDISPKTLSGYYRSSVGCTEKVWRLYGEGKIKYSVLINIASLPPGDQNFFVDEIIEKKLMPSVVRQVRQIRKKYGYGFPECIARATGKIPLHRPRKESAIRKNIDSLLDEISAKAARWRAMVSQAIEMIDEEGAKAGIHEQIFMKVFLLRDNLRTQYDFVNDRVDQYMEIIQKNYKKEASESEEMSKVVDITVDPESEAAPQPVPASEPEPEPEPEPERVSEPEPKAERPAAAPELTPIPEEERKSYKERMAKHGEL